MSKTEPVNYELSLLLEPISAKKPSGESLRYTEVYDQIREARREEDKNLPQGVWKTEIKKADWEHVNQICQDALKTRSKDIQIAAWLTEAWLHLDGMQGLSRGLELILGLTEHFWPDVYPQFNDKGYELRIAPYEWINSRLSEEIASVAISAPTDHTALPYHFIDYNEANLRQFSKKNASVQNSSHQNETSPVSSSKISLSIDQTPTAFFRFLNEGCESTLKIATDLEEILRLHLEGLAPGFYRLREKTEGIQRLANHVLDERGEKNSTKKNETKEASPRPAPVKFSKVTIESRDQAYTVLSEVAAYLERIEPHSPTPYLIHRAIAWGDMSLSQVVETTLKSGNDMSLLLDILNVKKDHI